MLRLIKMMKLNWLRVEMKIEKSINLIQAFGLQLHGDVLQGQVNHHYHNHRCHHFHHHNWYCQRWLTWMTSFTKALSVPILAFFMTDTFGPIQVQKTNFDLLDSSSPVCNDWNYGDEDYVKDDDDDQGQQLSWLWWQWGRWLPWSWCIQSHGHLG